MFVFIQKKKQCSSQRRSVSAVSVGMPGFADLVTTYSWVVAYTPGGGGTGK
jgi:hypothetical protein